MFDDSSCSYLLPGGLIHFDFPAMVNTVLGSCVTVTMFARKQAFGIISHSMLPGGKLHRKENRGNYKFTDVSIMRMDEMMTERGIRPEDVEVKLFGGSDMFSVSNPSFSVGRKNTAAAVSMLKELKYTVMAQDTGGQFTRKLYFSTETGTVYVRRISKLQVL